MHFRVTHVRIGWMSLTYTEVCRTLLRHYDSLNTESLSLMPSKYFHRRRIMGRVTMTATIQVRSDSVKNKARVRKAPLILRYVTPS